MSLDTGPELCYSYTMPPSDKKPISFTPTIKDPLTYRIDELAETLKELEDTKLPTLEEIVAMRADTEKKMRTDFEAKMLRFQDKARKDQQKLYKAQADHRQIRKELEDAMRTRNENVLLDEEKDRFEKIGAELLELATIHEWYQWGRPYQ